MTRVEAIYENGVLRPLEPLELQEHEHVTLTVDRPTHTTNPALDWLNDLREQRRKLYDKYGYFPDSTQSIAEDRQRDI